MNLILIGMPGSGKSTVGARLAKRLGKRFYDTDLLLRQKMGETLQACIDRDGTAAFLAAEESVLTSLNAADSVIATGGSAVYSASGMAHLKEGGVCVYLYADADCIMRRLKDFSARGIALRDGMTIADLYAERKDLYEKYADVTVQVSDGDVEDAVRRIIAATELFDAR